jgi:hypothetical protein
MRKGETTYEGTWMEGTSNLISRIASKVHQAQKEAKSFGVSQFKKCCLLGERYKDRYGSKYTHNLDI